MYDAATRIELAHKRKSERVPYEGAYREQAKLIRLLNDDFSTKSPGGFRGAGLYDSTPIYAAENLAAGFYGYLSSPAQRWFEFEHPDEELNRHRPVREWMETVSHITLKSFSEAQSSFYATVPQLFGDIAGFGMSCGFSVDVPGDRRFLDITIPLAEIFIDTNHYGEVDTLDRMYSMSARQMAQQFVPRGEAPSKYLPEKVVQKLDREPGFEFPVIHAVFPNEDYRPRALGWRGKPFVSMYICEEGKHVLQRGGYWEFPYETPRWAVAGGEKYGRGPAMNAMPDIRMLQAMVRTLIRRANREADPPILAPNEGHIRVMRNVPGKITYGGMALNGAQLVRELTGQTNFSITLEMINSTRQAIKDAFFFSILQLVSRTGMTATEVMERNEEKMTLMGPNLGRIQTEFLTPRVTRRFNMLVRRGVLPPPPPELAGEDLVVAYKSPMAKAQKAALGHATVRFLEGAQGAMALDPQRVAARVDVDAVLDVLQDAFGAPAKTLRPVEVVDQQMQQAQQAQQLLTALSAGQQGADIVNKLAPVMQGGEQ